MSIIFINHSSVDATLVAKFIELLVSGIGISSTEIFCSSLPGSIEPGKNITEEAREKIQQSSLVISIVSHSFNTNKFCLLELGAAWVLQKPNIFILVPPITLNDVVSILVGRFGVRIDSDDDLSTMRDTITEKLGIRGNSTSIWEMNRRNFVRNISELMRITQIWLYVLVSYREEGIHKVIGCFRTQSVPKVENAITASGRAYWVSPKLSLRGEWITDESLFYGADINLHYTMQSPPHGEILNLQKPETHQGIIRLKQRNDFTPIIGDLCYSGYVHDLFSWSDNTPSIYAEPVAMSWDEAITEIETKGLELYDLLSPRLGCR